MKVLFLISLLATSVCAADFSWNTKENDPIIRDTAAKIAGKTAVTLAAAAVTGGALLAAQRVCRWSEVLDSPYSFLAIAAALLYAQDKTVEEILGEEYSKPSLYASIVMMLAMAGVIIHQGGH